MEIGFITNSVVLLWASFNDSLVRRYTGEVLEAARAASATLPCTSPSQANDLNSQTHIAFPKHDNSTIITTIPWLTHPLPPELSLASPRPRLRHVFAESV